jgi:hypothetical protein
MLRQRIANKPPPTGNRGGGLGLSRVLVLVARLWMGADVSHSHREPWAERERARKRALSSYV